MKVLLEIIKYSPLFICIVGIVYLVFLFSSKFMRKPQIEEHKISIEIIESNKLHADTTSYNINQIKALLKELQLQENNINEKYELLIKAREDESNTIQYHYCPKKFSRNDN